MWEQTFQIVDIWVVLVLILLEGLLSADNALVLAIMVRHLPKEEQRKALLYGLGGAFVFRLIAIVLATSIIKLWWLQAVGAIYLLALPIKHFLTSRAGPEAKPVNAGFWRTVIAVELADIAFAIDSVLAGVAMVAASSKEPHTKIWVVFVGAIIGVVLLRFAAGALIRVLDIYPSLDHVAYVLVGWVGVKLAMMAGHNGYATLVSANGNPVPEMSPVIFWTVLVIICVVGGLSALRKPAPRTLEPEAQRAEEASGE